MDQFQKYLVWFMPFWVLLVFGLFLMHWRRHKRYGIVFPQVSPEHIRFEERAASGCSHKTMFTKLGGAGNCLHITVTNAEVWIRLVSPLSIFAQHFDLEHRIQRGSITSIQPTQSAFVRSLLLDYRDERGQAHRLSLKLRKPDEFMRALDLQLQAV